MWYLIFIPCGFVLYFFLSSLVDMVRISKYVRLYEKFKDNKSKEFIPYLKLANDLIDKSKVKNSLIPLANGEYLSVQHSACGCDYSNWVMVTTRYYQMLLQARAVFRFNALNSLNPLKWFELCLMLPKHILTYVNVQSKRIINIFQALYWIASAAAILIQIIKSINI